jgi:hypothetical protein
MSRPQLRFIDEASCRSSRQRGRSHAFRSQCWARPGGAMGTSATKKEADARKPSPSKMMGQDQTAMRDGGKKMRAVSPILENDMRHRFS